MILNYDFDDVYREGPDSFRVVVRNYQYTVKRPTEEDLCLNIDELKAKYRYDAFINAACDVMCGYTDFMVKAYE